MTAHTPAFSMRFASFTSSESYHVGSVPTAQKKHDEIQMPNHRIVFGLLHLIA